MNSNVNLFEQADQAQNAATQDEKLREIAQALYDHISEFYMFLVNAIEPEDYVRMQEHLGYTESYQDHINSLTEGIPSKETTLQQISDFLGQYRVFVDEQYVTVLKQLNDKIHQNREMCKLQAYQILQQQSESLKQREAQLNQGMTQSKIEVLIGGKIMSLNTHNNPLLVSLYSMLLLWFSLTHYGEPPKSVVYTE